MRYKSFGLSLMLSINMMALSQEARTDPALYKVVEGSKVDENTFKGWRTWRALACERCHGAQQEGLVGPALVDSLKRLSREQFEQTVLKGRVEKGMPNFGSTQMASDNIEGLYAYLKGRSDGAIQPGRLEEMQ